MYSTSDVLSRENALFTVDDIETHHHYASFEVMKDFANLYRLGNALDSGDDHRKELYTLAAVSETDGGILLAVRNYEGRVEILLQSCPFAFCTVKKTVPGGTRGKGTVYRSKELDLSSGRLLLSVKPGEVYYVSLGGISVVEQ
jgi:hypothetical protein